MTLRTTKLIVANWKMNGSQEFVRDFVAALAEKSEKQPSSHAIVICPPFPYLTQTLHRLFSTKIQCGGQDCAKEEKGAYTGDVSSFMLKDIGCQYVIVGHSERRRSYNESNELIRQKAEMALKAEIIPIICIGESLEEREGYKTLKVLEKQLQESLPQREGEFVIAYEPVWAIGTGKTATSQEILEVHRFIRTWLQANRNHNADAQLLYGGSVTEENAKEILSLENVDGVLVGGASLKIEAFWLIACQ